MPKVKVISRRSAQLRGLLSGLVHLHENDTESVTSIAGFFRLLPVQADLVVLDLASFDPPHPEELLEPLRAALGSIPLVTVVSTDDPATLRRCSFPFSEALLFDPFDLAQAKAALEAVLGPPASANPQADSLDALAIFLRGVSNEVLNPLTSISGVVQVLLHEEDKQSERAKRFETVLENVARIQNTLRELEHFVRGRKPQRQVLHLGPLLGELENHLADETPPLQLGLEAADTLEPIMGDRKQLEVALAHLVRFASGSGSPVKASLHQARGHCLLQIAGTAPVQLPSSPDRLFFPYHDVPGEKGPGNLQLAAAYGIVRAHQGSLSVRSGHEGEVLFSLKFPHGPKLNSPTGPA
jgi:signal transduction histidine kinase